MFEMSSVMQYVESTPEEETAQSRILYHALFEYLWMDPTGHYRCEMCHEQIPYNEKMKFYLLMGLCATCYRMDVSPVRPIPFDGYSFLENRPTRPVKLLKKDPYHTIYCAACDELCPRFKRIRTPCCKKVICETCYLETAIDPEIRWECPLGQCGGTLPVLPVVLESLAFDTGVKPIYRWAYPDKSYETCLSEIHNDAYLAQIHSRLSTYRWLVDLWRNGYETIKTERNGGWERVHTQTAKPFTF